MGRSRTNRDRAIIFELQKKNLQKQQSDQDSILYFLGRSVFILIQLFW